MRRAITALVAAGLLVAGSYGLRAITDAPAPVSAPEQTPSPRLHELERLIPVFEQRVADHGDPLDMGELGRLYLERASLAGDLTDYGSAISSLEAAVALAPEDRSAALRLAQASLAVHQFDDALRIANDLVDSDPSDAAALLVVSDAEFEIGDGEAATETLDRAATLTGEIPEILTRRAQHADVVGDLPAAFGYAEEALRLTDTPGVDPRRLAFHLTFAAHFLNDLGRHEQAENMLRRAIEVDPSWSSSRATLGTVLLSSGRLEEAFAAYQAAVAIRPDPSTLAMLGDLSVALGEERRAETYYEQVEPAATLTEVHQQAYRRTLAQFLADRDLEPERAVELAMADVAQRSDPFGIDTHAWALYRAGETDQARIEIDRVLGEGLREPQILYHSALIALAQGDLVRAEDELTEALDKAPMFHPLQAPHAKTLLESLG